MGSPPSPPPLHWSGLLVLWPALRGASKQCKEGKPNNPPYCPIDLPGRKSEMATAERGEAKESQKRAGSTRIGGLRASAASFGGTLRAQPSLVSPPKTPTTSPPGT